MKKIGWVLFAFLILSGCAGYPRTSGCDIDASRQFFDADPGSLLLHVASPVYSDSKDPYLSLGPVGSHPGMRVDLHRVTPDDLGSIDSAECRLAEIRSFQLQVSESEWGPYWQESRFLGQFSAGIGVPGMTETTRVEEVGFAAVSKETRVVEFACGCLQGSSL